MNTNPTFAITNQPTETTCGPASLYAVYRHFGLDISLEEVIDAVQTNPWGGTLAVHLALDALKRGFAAEIYTANLQMFDPTWFTPGGRDLREGLAAQMEVKTDPKLRLASLAYLEYLDKGGIISMEDISFDLISQLLTRTAEVKRSVEQSVNQQITQQTTQQLPPQQADRQLTIQLTIPLPIIAGLSCTWLYRCMRERDNSIDDDIGGDSSGHFVVVYGVDKDERELYVADPYSDHPFSQEQYYKVSAARLIGAIMLGIVTFDAKLLVIYPRSSGLINLSPQSTTAVEHLP